MVQSRRDHLQAYQFAVERIARDTNCFTFLKLSRAKTLDIILGDARLDRKSVV